MTIPVRKVRTTARAKAKAQASTCVVGYLRCSTEEQAASGLGLEAQRAAVEAACQAKGWTVTEWAVDEGVSGSVAPADRPALAAALARLDACEAGALVAAKVDRLSRTTSDLLALHDRAKRDGWALVALDLNVDTSTPTGELMLTMLAAFATWERQQIAQRTRDALAAKKARGQRLGRPVVASPARARLRELVETEPRPTHAALAAALNAEGHRTPTGLEWTVRHVAKALDSLRLDDVAASV